MNLKNEYYKVQNQEIPTNHYLDTSTKHITKIFTKEDVNTNSRSYFKLAENYLKCQTCSNYLINSKTCSKCHLTSCIDCIVIGSMKCPSNKCNSIEFDKEINESIKKRLEQVLVDCKNKCIGVNMLNFYEHMNSCGVDNMNENEHEYLESSGSALTMGQPFIDEAEMKDNTNHNEIFMSEYTKLHQEHQPNSKNYFTNNIENNELKQNCITPNPTSKIPTSGNNSGEISDFPGIGNITSNSANNKNH